MNEQEASWVQEAQGGNRHSFRQLVEVYQRPIYNLTFRLLGHPQDAEEAAQETFLRAYARLHQYDGEHKFSTWLLAIASHYCIDRQRTHHVAFVSMDDNPVLQNLPDERSRSEEQLLAEEEAVEVQTLLARLEPAYRTPLILRYWEEYTHEQIAETMGLSVPAVKSRLFRARQQMAAFYQAAERTVAPPSADGRWDTTSIRRIVDWRGVWLRKVCSNVR